MKNMLLLILSILSLSCSFKDMFEKHRFQIIRLIDYYHGKGAIIPDSLSQFWYAHNKTITPSIDQVKQAERILRKDLYNKNMKILKSGLITYYSQNKPKTKEDSIKIVKKMVGYDEEFIFDAYRQYMGFIDTNNNVHIFIHLFEYNSFETWSEYSNWMDEYFIGCGNFSEQHSRSFTINLKEEEIE